jgi:hypothetical protein
MFISNEVRFDIRQVDGLKADSKRQQRPSRNFARGSAFTPAMAGALKHV